VSKVAAGLATADDRSGLACVPHTDIMRKAHKALVAIVIARDVVVLGGSSGEFCRQSH
jgi:hypothetical protein